MGNTLELQKAAVVPVRVPVWAFAVACDLLLAGGCAPPQSVDRAEAADAGLGAATADPPPPLPGRPAAPPAKCGNGELDPAEDCDLGPLNRIDAYGPGQCTVTCTRAPSCGDGTVNGPEQCDDGPKNSETDGAYGSMGQCNVLCRRITLYCGDQVVTPPETCDLGPQNSDSAYGPGLCNSRCLIAPACGDGKPDMREECDDGPANNMTDKIWSLQGGGCNRMCRKIVQRCGDAMTNAPDEDCDAGMMNTQSDMTYGSGPACNRLCKKVSYCGDGHRDPVEHCDLGTRNTNSDKFWALTPGGCNRGCFVIYRYCGDGFVEGAPDEECDLGPGRNTGAPGGCNNRCRLVPP